MQNGKTSIL